VLPQKISLPSEKKVEKIVKTLSDRGLSLAFGQGLLSYDAKAHSFVLMGQEETEKISNSVNSLHFARLSWIFFAMGLMWARRIWIQNFKYRRWQRV